MCNNSEGVFGVNDSYKSNWDSSAFILMHLSDVILVNQYIITVNYLVRGNFLFIFDTLAT